MVPLCITLKIDDEDDDDEDEEDEDEDDDDDWRAQWACSRKNLFKPLWASTSAWQSIILSLNLRDDEDDEDDEDDDEDELHMSTSSFMARLQRFVNEIDLHYHLNMMMNMVVMLVGIHTLMSKI